MDSFLPGWCLWLRKAWPQLYVLVPRVLGPCCCCGVLVSWGILTLFVVRERQCCGCYFLANEGDVAHRGCYFLSQGTRQIHSNRASCNYFHPLLEAQNFRSYMPPPPLFDSTGQPYICVYPHLPLCSQHGVGDRWNFHLRYPCQGCRMRTVGEAGHEGCLGFSPAYLEAYGCFRYLGYTILPGVSPLAQNGRLGCRMVAGTSPRSSLSPSSFLLELPA